MLRQETRLREHVVRHRDIPHRLLQKIVGGKKNKDGGKKCLKEWLCGGHQVTENEGAGRTTIRGLRKLI